jgi:hypothetical protein
VTRRQYSLATLLLAVAAVAVAIRLIQVSIAHTYPPRPGKAPDGDSVMEDLRRLIVPVQVVRYDGKEEPTLVASAADPLHD